MKRWAPVIAAVAALGLGIPAALAVPTPKGSASAAASAAPAAKGTAAPSASAAASAAPAPSTLPPGHPGVPGGVPGAAPGGVPEGNLPPGHPSVDGDEDGDGPEGARDMAVDDPTLPVGTLVVAIKDGEDKPLSRAPVTMDATHGSETKGVTNERLARETDEAGAARFEGLPIGSTHTYRLSTSRGGANYVLAPFTLSARAGKRVTLHAFEATGKLDGSVIVVMRGAMILSLKDDAIQVHQLITVMNMGKTAWLADMPVGLPAGFKAFSKQDAADDARIEEVAGSGAAIRGTFPPGQRDLEFLYQVPLEGDAVQSLSLKLPQRITQMRVIAEASKNMALEVKGFPPAKHADGRDGKRMLVTDLAARTPGEASSIDITLSGLPTRGPGRWIAVALAVLALGAGIAYYVQTSGDLADEDARRDLTEARDALLDEIVALERAHKNGEIGPKTYGRVRTSLLDALARIVAMIEAAEPAKKPAPGKVPRGGAGPRPRRAEASP